MNGESSIVTDEEAPSTLHGFTDEEKQDDYKMCSICLEEFVQGDFVSWSKNTHMCR